MKKSTVFAVAAPLLLALAYCLPAHAEHISGSQDAPPDAIDIVSYFAKDYDYSNLHASDGDETVWHEPAPKAIRDALANADSDALQMFVNGIFARHGYIFHKPKVAAAFRHRRWYSERSGDQDEIYGSLSDLEKSNVKYIQSLKNY